MECVVNLSAVLMTVLTLIAVHGSTTDYSVLNLLHHLSFFD